MKNYSQEELNKLAADNRQLIIEFKDGDIEVGTLSFDGFGELTLYPIDTAYYRARSLIKRSYIKRIIFLNTGLVIPKESIINTNKHYKILNILEMNELLNKAGYQYI